MKTSNTIESLITLLSNNLVKDYDVLLNNFDFDSIDFKPYQSWSKAKYTRNCLHKDSNFELILLCWEYTQETPIHGHDGKDCWVYLLEGEMEEVFFKLDDHKDLKEHESQKVMPHQLTFMHDTMGFHKLKNSFKGRSVSLHLYAKPMSNCMSFDEDAQEFVKRALRYDTRKSLIVKN